MSRDPFDESRRLEMLIQKLLKARGAKRVPKGGVFIRKSGGKTKIDIRGDVPNSMIGRLKRKYPDAEISNESKKERVPKPRDTVVEKVEKSGTEERPEEMDPGKLALKRLREKKEEGQREDSPAEEGESE